MQELQKSIEMAVFYLCQDFNLGLEGDDILFGQFLPREMKSSTVNFLLMGLLIHDLNRNFLPCGLLDAFFNFSKGTSIVANFRTIPQRSCLLAESFFNFVMVVYIFEFEHRLHCRNV